MSYTHLYDMAIQGMHIEKLRVDLVANNIANQHTAKTRTGILFQPSVLKTTAIPFEEWIAANDAQSIDAITHLPQQLPPNKVWQPGHPDADSTGYVTYPGISTVDEMVTLLGATRAYEANIKVFNTAHTLYNRALTIGEDK